MTSRISVRKATEADAKKIMEFNMAMALETEDKQLDPQTVGEGVRALFRHPEYGFYLIAETEGRIAGTLMITNEWSDWRNGLFWWIQSVYVIPEYRRLGVYRSMYQTVRQMAENTPKVCGCRLYVEKENSAAQQTYRKLGMSETYYKMYEELFR